MDPEIQKLFDLRKFEQVVTVCKLKLTENPTDISVLYALAMSQAQIGREQEALENLNKVIQLSPDATNVRLQRANLVRKLGNPLEALEEYRAIYKLIPNNVSLLTAYSYTTNLLGQFDEAIMLYTDNHELFLSSATLSINLGNTFRGVQQYKKAIKIYENALNLDARYKEAAIGNIAAVKIEMGSWKEAYSLFLELDENNLPTEALMNLATLEAKHGNYKKAVSLLEKAQNLGLNNSQAKSLYARYLDEIDLPEKAYSYLKTECAIYLDPTIIFAKLNIALKYGFFEDQANDIAYLNMKLKDDPNIEVDAASAFMSMALPNLDDEIRFNIAAAMSKRLGDTKPLRNYHIKSNSRKINIGYLTGDLADHPVAHLMYGVWSAHDKNKFEIYFYDTRKSEAKDIYFYRCVAKADHYRDVSELDSIDIAKKISDDKIDVIIDLSGYTRYGRTEALTYKPARVAMSYLGYVGSTGSDAIDYLIADSYVIPDSKRNLYTENIIYMPDCYHVNYGKLHITDNDRNFFNLPKCFLFNAQNNNYKLNYQVIKTWSEILLECSSASIILYARNALHRKNLLKEFEHLGVESNRIVFVERQTRSEFLNCLSVSDLFLDTWPYNGGATVHDALKVSLPVLTLAQSQFASRMAGSMLTNLGLNGLISNSRDEYRDKAIECYYNAELLKQYKTDLSTRYKDSILNNNILQTRYLEDSFMSALDMQKKRELRDIIVEKRALVDAGENKVTLNSDRMSSQEVIEIQASMKRIGDDYFDEFNTLIEKK